MTKFTRPVVRELPIAVVGANVVFELHAKHIVMRLKGQRNSVLQASIEGLFWRLSKEKADRDRLERNRERAITRSVRS